MRELRSVLLAVFVLAGACHGADESAPTTAGASKPFTIGEADAKATVNLLLNDPHMTPGLRAALGEVSKGPRGVTNRLWDLFDIKTKRHVGGCDIGLGGAGDWFVRWDMHARPPLGPHWLTAEQAKPVAEAIKQQTLPVLHLAGSFVLDRTPDQPSSENDAYTFVWSRSASADTPSASLAVAINAFTGKGTAVWVSVSSPDEDPVKTAELRKQSVSLLAKYMREHELGELDERMIFFEWHGQHNLPEGWRFFWGASITLDDATGDTARIGSAGVYPEAGKVVFQTGEYPGAAARLAKAEHIPISEAQERVDGGLVESEEVISDEWPCVWDGGKAIALMSNRAVATYPHWRHPPRRVCIMDSEGGGISALSFAPDLPILDGSLAATLNAKWIAYQTTDWLCLLNTQTGAKYTLNTEQTETPIPLSISSRLPRVYGPVYMDSGKTEWRAYEPPAKGGQLASRRVEGLSERDLGFYPAPDDSQATVVTQVQRQPPQFKVSVATMRSDGSVGDRKVVVQSLAAEPIASWSSDGSAVYLASHVGVSVLDLSTGQARPLALPAQQDPDTKQPLVIATESVRAFGEGRVLFCAREQNAPARRGSRIYAMQTHGTALVRLTPLDDAPMPVHRFPASGKPAFTLFPPAQAR